MLGETRKAVRVVVWGVAVLVMAGAFSGCGRSKPKFAYDTNLLQNPSFEKAGPNGVPVGWELSPFRGLKGQLEVKYGLDKKIAHGGSKSFFFYGDPATRRWYHLVQEVEVPAVEHVRLQGWMQTDHVRLHPDQYAQCNFLLTFYNKDHHRFQELRFADKRTRLKVGTRLWFKEDDTFRVPDGTRYIAVSCILGMDGEVWFDDVSLSVPKPVNWQTEKTPNYVYHWLPGNPPPKGAIAAQQEWFDYYAQRLGVKSNVVINYYFYPDTATIRSMLSLKGYQYTSWDDREIHTINPNDNHEVVHFITDPYGKPPRSIAEGTVFWLQDDWNGKPILPTAAGLLKRKRLPPLQDLTNYNQFTLIDPNESIPASAAFVSYIVNRYGTKMLLEFYKALNGVNSYQAFSGAFKKVYGIEATQAEKEFHAALAMIDTTTAGKKPNGPDAGAWP